MAANREIKIYGTLVNATVNGEVADANHNDALGYAYQIYDDRFGDSTPVNNFQDNINKRVTAISYTNGVTTIKNNVVADNIRILQSAQFDRNIITNGINSSDNIVAPNITQMASDLDALEDYVSRIIPEGGVVIAAYNICEDIIDELY